MTESRLKPLPQPGVVILGTGHAGYTLAREFRKLDRDTALALVTRDDGVSYYKPDISKAFASGKDSDGLIKATREAAAKELDADIRANTEVRALDPAAHSIKFESGALEYRQLVLASGASPIRTPVAGDAADAVFRVNSRLDYARFRAGLKAGDHILIIGAGLIGCEFANDFGAHGFSIAVADLAPWPLPRLLPEPCGRALQDALARLGVTWHLEASVARLERDGARLRATLSSGATLTVDRVLSAVGLRPDLSLAKAAGLACRLGIVVDDFLKTSATDVYGLGDCVEIAGRVMPFVLPIAHGARALAQTLAGRPTRAAFPAMPVLVKTPACPVIVCPPPDGAGEWRITGAAPDLEAVFVDASGRELGFALTGAATARRGALAAKMPPVTGPFG